MTYEAGQQVRIRSEWCEVDAEAQDVYTVVENNGDRLIIELNCDLPIKPQSLVCPSMVESAHPWVNL